MPSSAVTVVLHDILTNPIINRPLVNLFYSPRLENHALFRRSFYPSRTLTRNPYLLLLLSLLIPRRPRRVRYTEGTYIRLLVAYLPLNPIYYPTLILRRIISP
jgi:hypothetical protein